MVRIIDLDSTVCIYLWSDHQTIDIRERLRLRTQYIRDSDVHEQVVNLILHRLLHHKV
jgi:hypothetical protein